MLPAFNTDVTHRGATVHAQTEDHGAQNPVIESHLFLGGSVVASRRRSYAHLLNLPNRDALVRQQMEEQHRKIVSDLTSGTLDSVIARQRGEVEGRKSKAERSNLENVVAQYLTEEKKKP